MKTQFTIFLFIILICASKIFPLSDEYKIQTKEQAYDVAIQVTGF